MGRSVPYELLEWASSHLNPDEYAEARKYQPGQVPPDGEYVDARDGSLVVVRGTHVPNRTVYLSLQSLSDHGSYTL